jgi:uncharacterized protein YyaL (SSP411 family)
MSGGGRNRLAAETSPYLLQHARNPVDWYPWNDEAFRRARDRDVPIFLSVGYAACHWCHVMERESFEDDATAAFLNEHFVSVKVDREERPDVDAIYMDAVQSMTGAGGWPMSVFLTPDGRPFYSGTYFPDRPRHGLPSFRQVLEGIAEAWASRRADVEALGRTVADGISRAAELLGSGAATVDDALPDRAFNALAASFDPTWGGFGSAPKFPQPMVLEWLLRQHERAQPRALELVTRTLDRMAAGGIHDHVGGGFARYSTDVRWHVPHFEKMLSDNAQLLQLYTHAWLVTHEARYRAVAERTASYLLDELQQNEGGFSASQDADSEGVEGRFYVWAFDELVELVGAPVADAFGATATGNWEGANILWRPEPTADVANRHGMTVAELEGLIEEARGTLLKRRGRRVPPSTDDKVVTAWNGLALGAFAIAGRAFQDSSYIAAATRCAELAWEALRDGDRLLRSWRDGRAAAVDAFLDDHALLGLGFLALYEASGRADWFVRARALGDAILDRFVGPSGELFQTAADAEPLLFRPRDVQDTATPSGTSSAAELLARLSMFTGRSAYRDAAERALRPLGDLPARAPAAFGHALSVADLLQGPSREVAIVGTRGEGPTDALVREVDVRYLPNLVLAVGHDDEVVPLLDGRRALDGRPTAYVCERFACQLPVTDPAAFIAQLPATGSTGRR